MKKFLSMILALALVMSLGTVAFAAPAGPEPGPGITISSNNGETWEGGNADGSGEINVQLAATLKDAETVYNVEIQWTSMAFEYQNGQKQWNTGTHTESVINGTWSNSGKATVTVINHSNKGVKVSGEYSDSSNAYKDGYKGVTIAFTPFEDETLQPGVLNTPAGTLHTDKTTGTLSVTGAPEENITQATVGTVKVTISKADA